MVVVWVRVTVMRFVTQEGGNCRSFLHNCAFVPLPGGYRASLWANKTWTGVKEDGATAQPKDWKRYFNWEDKTSSASWKQELNATAPLDGCFEV